LKERRPQSLLKYIYALSERRPQFGSHWFGFFESSGRCVKSNADILGKGAAAGLDSVNMLFRRAAAAADSSVEIPLLRKAAAASDSDDILFLGVAAACPNKTQMLPVREAAALWIQ